jgi:hypothetical protein
VSGSKAPLAHPKLSHWLTTFIFDDICVSFKEKFAMNMNIAFLKVEIKQS